MQTLDALYDKVSIGGFIILDDFARRTLSYHAKEAAIAFRRKRNINGRLIRIDEHSAYWQKKEGNQPVSDKDNPYGTVHFMRKRTYVGWRGPIIAKAIKDVLNPKSVVDVGCGIGEIAKGLLDLGVDVIGVEGSMGGRDYYKLPLNRYHFLDIRSPEAFIPYPKYDLVICLEVLSVIKNENNCHDIIIQNLKKLSDNIFINHIDKILGYQEIPEIAKAIQSHLLPWKHKSGMRALFSTKFFRKEE